jgi:hypothetical protein
VGTSEVESPAGPRRQTRLVDLDRVGIKRIAVTAVQVIRVVLVEHVVDTQTELAEALEPYPSVDVDDPVTGRLESIRRALDLTGMAARLAATRIIAAHVLHRNMRFH